MYNFAINPTKNLFFYINSFGATNNRNYENLRYGKIFMDYTLSPSIKSKRTKSVQQITIKLHAIEQWSYENIEDIQFLES